MPMVTCSRCGRSIPKTRRNSFTVSLPLDDRLGVRDAAEQALDLAARYAQEAIDDDPLLAEAHTTLGYVYLVRDLDLARSEAEERRGAGSGVHIAIGTVIGSLVPGREDHVRAHNRFRQELAQMAVDVDEHDQISRQLISTFLREWLTRHICGIDKDLEAFLLASKVH